MSSYLTAPQRSLPAPRSRRRLARARIHHGRDHGRGAAADPGDPCEVRAAAERRDHVWGAPFRVSQPPDGLDPAYTPDGNEYLTIVCPGGTAGLPKNIADKVISAHPGYAITAAQRYESGGLVAFRVELRQGSTKNVKWTDAAGTGVSSSNLPDGAEEIAK